VYFSIIRVNVQNLALIILRNCFFGVDIKGTAYLCCSFHLAEIRVPAHTVERAIRADCGIVDVAMSFFENIDGAGRRPWHFASDSTFYGWAGSEEFC
jgi:hypothetical protein